MDWRCLLKWLFCVNFFLLYTANAQQSTILIVRPDSKDTKAVTFLDPVNDEEASLKIRDQFKGYNIVEIETDSISKIKGDSRLKDITVSGIVFMGHSNEKQYGLNKEVFYTGESLAPAMASSLADTQIADDLIVYFDGCKAGACERDGILREFHENFNEKIDKRKGPTRIYSIGHTNTTEWDKSNPLAAPSALDRIIKKTKIPAALYKVSSGLSTVVGPYSMAATN